MKTLQESIAQAMDCDDLALLPHLPYILQDFTELGSLVDSISAIIQENLGTKREPRILDIGCGKGAVLLGTLRLVAGTGTGIDGVPQFIEAATTAAEQQGTRNCSFICADIRQKLPELGHFDVIILGSIGPVLGDHQQTMEALETHLAPGGIPKIPRFHFVPADKRDQLVCQDFIFRLTVYDFYPEN